MSKLYYGSIDLNKIDKSKIVSKDKNGNPFENGAKYLNVAMWVNDEPDQYGNTVSIQQSLSKEERENGAKAVYIGNLKSNDPKPQNENAENLEKLKNAVGGNSTEEDELPF